MFAVASLGFDAEGETLEGHLAHRLAGGADEEWAVARGSDGDAPALEIEVDELGGDEHLDAIEVGIKDLIEPLQEQPGAGSEIESSTDVAAEDGGEHGGRDALAHDIGDDEQRACPRDLDHIVLKALKKNPGMVECSEADNNYLEKIILPWAKSNLPKAKKETRELLKTKFLPMNLRSRLWKRFVENPGNITKKTYIAYRDLVQKQTAANPSYASSSIIEQNVNSSIKLLTIEPANQQTEVKNSVTRMLLVFEYFQPDVGYVIGTEKLVYFLRRLMDEETCFIIFYNIYFTSEFLWGLLTNDHE